MSYLTHTEEILYKLTLLGWKVDVLFIPGISVITSQNRNVTGKHNMKCNTHRIYKAGHNNYIKPNISFDTWKIIEKKHFFDILYKNLL